jgi:hypothetical protein
VRIASCDSFVPKERRMALLFHPGDNVIWLKQVAGDFVFPVKATVLAVTAKRVKIEADDPEEGKLIRHVAPSSLQAHEQRNPAKGSISKNLPAGRAKRGRPSRPVRDEEREHRISYDIVVDAYDQHERAMGWYYYIEGQLQFPFTARCILKRAVSPLHVGDQVEVIGMPPKEECGSEVFVTIRWQKEGLAVPLAQLEPVKADKQTKQAIEDWHYWLRMGYQY